ncbi:MAG: hypothetical protein R2932_42000 [Caldilineaceae bacterium]
MVPPTAQLQGVSHLILPTVPAGHTPTWYNYVLRFDFDTLELSADANGARNALVRAQAEGLPTTVWQRFILPAMTVFQAKNAYGHGAPWSSPHAQPVDYLLEQYPVAQRHCDSHACLVYPLRYPNEPAMELIAEAIHKVMENAQAIVLRDE